MPNRSQIENLKIAQVFVTATRTADTTSDVIDTRGYDSAMAVFDIGNSGDTLSGTLYWTLSLTECETSDGSYTAVAAADIQVEGGTFGTTSTLVIDAPGEDSRTVKMAYLGSKRYFKAVATKTGSHSSGTPIGIISILSDANLLPVS